ncbi:hypothetical protein [Streptococcus catagoni]|uniref:hypothetical protein n=1 Tax=Streptococcus catagoni TaxID=2654874 RepID=UPI00140BAAFD|nr:hypothetical protein [Streptococcus catagoni]
MKRIIDYLENHSIILSLILLVWSVIFASVSMTVINGYVPAYDFNFHLARIVGLAQSFHYGDFLPSLNNIFSWGTGYASNMFYGNWQFYIPAFFYLLTKNTIIAYGIFGWMLILFDSFSTYFFLSKISKKKWNSFLIALVFPCFFPAYGFGMTMVVGFVPMLTYALYKVIYEDKTNPFLLAITIALLIQTHIISTLVLAIASMFFLLFNIKRITLRHVISFTLSACLGLLLTSGFIIQYIEQVRSQPFFFTWKTRNFPVNSDLMFDLKKSFSSGFHPLTNFFDIPLKLLALHYLFNFKSLKRPSKAILFLVIAMYLSMTSLLPWKSLLRYTILGTMQYTERLSYFAPAFLLMIVTIEANIKFIKSLVVGVLVVYFFNIVQVTGVANGEENQRRINDNNRKMSVVYDNPTSEFVNPIGNEYYTIDFDHVAVKDHHFLDVSNEKNVLVNSIRYGYNKVELSYEIIDPAEPASFVIPRIYYKGYRAKYSDGASGSQPILEKRQKTAKEKKLAEKLGMPKTDEKILNNGKIYLKLFKSGKVLVEYKKTPLQKIGYLIEFLSWIIILGRLVAIKVKDRKDEADTREQDLQRSY